MSASEVAVKAAEEAMGCHHGNGKRGCDAHWVGWTDRGCATAVAVADAVEVIAAREALLAAHGSDWVTAWIAARAEEAALKVPEPWERTEVMDFEPSDQFEMPEAMGIDYVPELLPAQLNKLAVYNSEVSRGIVHTPEWNEYMHRLQEAFNNSQTT